MKLRAAWCLLRVALHLCRGLLTVALVFPRCDELRKLRHLQQWSARLIDHLGVRLVWSGEVPRTGLLVSNHISFIDVYAINAIAPSSFVAKDEVRSWPLIGWLAHHTDTLFLERGSRGAAQRAREEIVHHLRAGKRVAVFPEGTTGNGDAVQPFHSAMFQGAIDADSKVTPIAIAYQHANGERHYAPAFVGDMSLVECLWSIACANGIIANVALLPAYPASNGDRRHLSTHTHKTISHRLDTNSHHRFTPPD